MINDSELILKIPELFEFRSIFIPKDNGQPRPIAIEESMLHIFSKLILRKLP